MIRLRALIVTRPASRSRESCVQIFCLAKFFHLILDIFPMTSHITCDRIKFSFLLGVTIYECETWSTTQGDENKLLTFERKTYENICTSVKPQYWFIREKKYSNLIRLYNASNLQDGVGWVLAMYGIQKVNWLDRLSSTSQIKNDPLGRPWQRWTDRVKDDLKRLRNRM